jgi:LytR cell envelope-related transcriptional attenuator
VTLPTYGYTTSGGAEVLGLQQPQASQAIAAFNAFGTAPAAKKAAPKSKSSASSTTAVTAPKVTVAPSSVNIEVANGTGQSGQAGQMSQFLAGLGYHAGITASSGYGRSTTEILYAPDSLTAAEQLAARIPGGATLVASPALTPTVYNVKVVTGSSYTNAGPGGSGAGASSTTSGAAGAAGTPGTSTTVPGTNPAVYELPGYAPGQTPPANC